MGSLKQASIHILCSIYIYILFMLYLIYALAHTQKTYKHLSRPRFTYCATKFFIYFNITTYVYFIQCTHTLPNVHEHTQAGPDSHTVLHIHILFLLLVLLVKHIHTQTNLQKLKQAQFTYCATKHLHM